MKKILMMAALFVVAYTQNNTRPTYFIHNISAERWNKYICESCKYNYHPVCGSDFKTYTNPCIFTCEAQKVPGLRLLHRGECITRKHEELSLYASGCPSCRVEPKTLICAQNEMTFYNVCYFECFRRKHGLFNLGIAHTGACFIDHENHLKNQGETETCICNWESLQGIFLRHQVAFRVKRVCGSVTLYNKCQYNCEAKKRGFHPYPGVCEDIEMYKYKIPELGTVTYNPCDCPEGNGTVCATVSDRESYAHLRKNKCYSTCEREDEVPMHHCLPRDCHCSDEYEPTCAMKLFRDICHFECFRRTHSPGISLHGVVACPARHLHDSAFQGLSRPRQLP